MLDNDLDGNIDAKDTGCSLTNPDNDNFGSTLESQLGSDPANINKTVEHGAFEATCSDGVVDNDQDGQINGADTGCDHIDADSDGFLGAVERALGSNPASAASTPESLAIPGTCTDTVNNDAEGGTDAADAGCVATNGDGDAYADVVETALNSNPASSGSTPEHAVFPATCSDSLNNDNPVDALTDGADLGCDAIDADGDGWAGAMERALGSDPANIAKTPESAIAGNSCTNGIDDDADATIDALDSSCGAINSDGDTWADAIETALGSSTTITSRTPEHAAVANVCEDALDNDGDTLIDADDSGCASIDADADSIQVVRGQQGTTAVLHDPNDIVTENVVDVPVSDADLTSVNSILRIDNERMHVKAVRYSPDVAEVIRAVNGTSVATHTTGVSITDIDGMGGFDFELAMDRIYADPFTGDLGSFLERCTTDTNNNGTVCDIGDEGREADCLVNIGSLEASTATLTAGAGPGDPVLSISDQSVLRVGASIRVNNEDMFIISLKEGTPDQMTVGRAEFSDSHSNGDPVLIQNSAVGGLRYVCTSHSNIAFNYGPTGDGTIAYVHLMPIQRTPPSPLPLEDINNQALPDVSGGPISNTLSEGRLTVAKCPDPNGSGKFTQSDWIEISRAALGIITPVVAKHDLNGNNSVGDEDRVIAARILFLYTVPVVECAVMP
jgi:hypothetical protein